MYCIYHVYQNKYFSSLRIVVIFNGNKIIIIIKHTVFIYFKL